MNLIALDRQTAQIGQHTVNLQQRAARLRRGLARSEHRVDRQQVHAAQTAAALGIVRVGDRASHHLIAAADAENRCACRVRLENLRLHAALAQPPQVCQRGLGARQDNQVGSGKLRRFVRVRDTHAGYTRKCGKIREIGQSRQFYHRNVYQCGSSLCVQTLGQAVLIVDVKITVRHHADDRLAGQILELRQTRPQNLHITAEFVDDETANPRLLVLLEQLDRAVQRREHAAAVDVADQQNGCIHQLRQTHIYNIILLEIDLRRTARTLDHDNVVLGGKAVKCVLDNGQKRLFAAPILPRGTVSLRLAHDDDLRANVACRLEQDRIHAHIGRDARRLGLHDLCAAHLPAVRRDERVERHVL